MNDEVCSCAQDPDRAEKIATLNDELRVNAQGGVVVATRGVRALMEYDGPKLMALLAGYAAFDEDNDPYGERDFGDLEFGGTELLWKIDYFDTDMLYGSPDPADPQVTQRVLTVMLASEW